MLGVTASEWVSGSFLLTDGTAAAPGVGFSAETGTGFFRPSTNHLRAMVGGVTATEWTTTGFGFFGNFIDNSFVTGTLVTSGTVTLSALLDFTGFHAATTLTASTVHLPPTTSVVQGQLAKFSVDQIVTALTVTTAQGGAVVTVKNGAITGVAGGVYGWIYNAADNSWYRAA